MTDKLGDSELCKLTSADESIAIAECTDGLGCNVFASGAMLAPWASNRVEELVGIHMPQRAVITSRATARYFILKRDRITEGLMVVRGPLNAVEVLGAL